MITLNLLPDIKKAFLHSQRVKRMFIISAILVSGVFVAAVVLLGLYVGGQNIHLNGVQKDIDESLTTLKSQPELSKVVTIQKQLLALPELHNTSPATERLLGYLGTVVPSDITLSKVEIIFLDNNTITLNGAGPNPKAINVFVDTLKNASFSYDGLEAPTNPFTQVVLESVSVGDEETSYNINLVYDPILFDLTINGGKLSVPKITSSTSVQERPHLFQELQEESGEN